MQDQPRRFRADAVVADADGGERRTDHVHVRHVVVAHHGNIFRAAQAQFADGIVTADGHQVAARHYGRRLRRLAQQRQQGRLAAFARIAAAFKHERVRGIEFAGLDGSQETEAAHVARGQVFRAGNVRDMAVAQRQQVLDGQAHADHVVADDAGSDARLVAAVDGDDRHILVDAHLDDGIVAPCGSQNQAVDLLPQQTIDDEQLFFLVGTHVGDDGQVAMLAQAFLDAQQDRREHRVGYVGQDHADDARLARDQGGGGAVGPVTEPARFGQHTRGHLGADHLPRCRVHHARDGGKVHAAGPRDVA